MAAQNVESFLKPHSVAIECGRWQVTINIIDHRGKEYKFVASADHGVTFGDGIFFGTLEEYKRACGL